MSKSGGFAVLEVGGIGYQMSMTTTSLAALPAAGDEVTVHTHLHVREDELSLFGFESNSEKAAFEQLLSISGVGPKVALATLSALSPEALSQAVAAQDVGVISSVPGIGKKTAQRMILELEGKLVSEMRTEADSADAEEIAQVRDALLAMGFTSVEAATAMKGGPSDAQSLLRHSLKRLGRQ